jgi:hypothetical protein
MATWAVYETNNLSVRTIWTMPPLVCLFSPTPTFPHASWPRRQQYGVVVPRTTCHGSTVKRRPARLARGPGRRGHTISVTSFRRSPARLPAQCAERAPAAVPPRLHLHATKTSPESGSGSNTKWHGPRLDAPALPRRREAARGTPAGRPASVSRPAGWAGRGRAGGDSHGEPFPHASSASPETDGSKGAMWLRLPHPR